MYQHYLMQQRHILWIKQQFTAALCNHLNLIEVEAPLLSDPEAGTQDTLSGVEQAVQVPIASLGRTYEVVHSLAKWKRQLLSYHEFPEGQGIVTHMKALRTHEDLASPIHSVMVDQWDWEQVIHRHAQPQQVLEARVQAIYAALKETARSYQLNCSKSLPFELPKQPYFITSEALLARYPELCEAERERAITQHHQVVFIQNIGFPLSDGKPHGSRAPDYDNWQANGDLLVWHPVLNCALELSSMGVRVNPQQLLVQWQAANRTEADLLPWHHLLLSEQLKASVGGGIGQSRLCMWLMQTPHIGLVQESVWPQRVRQKFGML